jgi:predicted RNase H-like HicB family nuclease
MDSSNLVFTGIIVQEEDEFVAYCTELDVVSQGETVELGFGFIRKMEK